jgi:acyl-CoA synthetase (AMP-forming)/AMP-acid ligase II
MTASESPVTWQTIPEMILDNVKRFAANEAVVDDDVRLTYEELGQLAGAVASGLRQRGLQPGDRVSIWGPNGWRWIVSACGAWLAGGVLVPLSTRFKGMEAGEVLRRAECTTLFTYTSFLGSDYLDMLEKDLGRRSEGRMFEHLESLETVVLMDDAEREVYPTLSGLIEEGRANPWSTEDLDQGPDDISEVLFTSGTTGRSKGVLLGNRQLLECYWDYGETAGYREGDRYLAIMPFGHGGGLNGCLTTSLIHGMTIVPRPTFDAVETLDTIARENITVLLGPPQLFLLATESSPDAHKVLRSLRIAITGAAAVPTTLMTTLKDEIGVRRVINCYGLIEGCVVSMTRDEDPDQVVTTTTGRAMPRVEIRIVDDGNQDLPVGEPGEILVRSYGVMKGYLDAGQLTAAVDPSGWLHTGDVGVLDANGNLRVVDRLKDVIIVGGFNAYPAEIENLILRRGDITSAAVFGLPDERLGEVPCAVIVPLDRSTFDPEEFMRWARENLSNYKVPRQAILAEELPMNATGKVDKRKLREEVLVGGLSSP